MSDRGPTMINRAAEGDLLRGSGSSQNAIERALREPLRPGVGRQITYNGLNPGWLEVSNPLNRGLTAGSQYSLSHCPALAGGRGCAVVVYIGENPPATSDALPNACYPLEEGATIFFRTSEADPPCRVWVNASQPGGGNSFVRLVPWDRQGQV